MKRNDARQPTALATLPARLLLGLLVGLSLLIAAVHASDQRYDYDEAGRLIRAIDEQGRVTEYRYDPVGNILQVATDAIATAPLIDTFTPARLNHGDRLPALATGSSLTGTRVTTSHPGLVASGVTTSDTRIDFELYADPDLPMGPQSLTFTTAAGSSSFSIEIRPEIPRVRITPVPLGRLPDGVMQPLLIWLSHPDVEAHTFTLSIADPSVAQVEQSSLTIPAGETEARTRLAGLRDGTTSLTIEAPGVAPNAVPVYVADQLAGINTRYATRLGVTLEAPAGPSPSIEIADLSADRLGVVYGSALHRIEPAQRTVGSSPAPLTLHGSGLEAAASVTLTPPDGVTLGPLTPSIDGTTLSVEASVAADAPLGPRRLTLFDAADAPLPTVVGGDRLLIIAPAPRIDSITPQHYAPGIPDQTLTLRGRHFSDLHHLDVTPADDIAIGTPEVTYDGASNGADMVITAAIAIAPDAQLGPRVVTVTTAGGSSTTATTPNNTFHISLGGNQHPNHNAPPVGVVLEAAPTPVTTHHAAYAAPVGVVRGATLTGLTPERGTIGTTLTLTVEGRGLSDAATVTLSPGDGITVEAAPTVAADGRSLSVPLTIAADAPTTQRLVSVTTADGTPMPSVNPAVVQFLVTPPPPVIEAVTPLFLLADATTTLTLRGRHFDDAAELRLIPGDGATIGPLTLNAEATEASATISLTPDAPLGPRVVQLVTPGGISDATPSARNSVTIADAPLIHYAPFTAPPIGVVLAGGEPPAPRYDAWSRPLGVVLLDPLDAPPQRTLHGLLGVTLGPVATALTPASALPGAGGLIEISGHGLDVATELRLRPADGVTLDGPLTVTPDGRTLSVAFSVDATATPGPRAVEPLDADGAPIPFADPSGGRLFIHGGIPTIHSIDPIIAGLDDTVTLTIRGEHLHTVQSVTVTPAEGVAISPRLRINDLGTEVSVPLWVAPDATLGPRVIRVHLTDHDTPAESTPANTFTVYETVP